MTTILDFPEVRQTFDYDCGASSLLGVLGYYGIEVQSGELIDKAGTESRNGTKISGMKKVIEAFGLKHDSGKKSISDIKSFIQDDVPVILLLQAWSDKKSDNYSSYENGHYAIAIGYGDGKIFFEDPSSLVRAWLTEEELLKRWHGLGDDDEKLVGFGMAVFGKKPVFSVSRFVKMGSTNMKDKVAGKLLELAKVLLAADKVTYEVVGLSGGIKKYKSTDEFVKEMKKLRINQRGVNDGKGQKEELVGQPKFDNLMGPFYGGPGVVRYETKETYKQLSSSERTASESLFYLLIDPKDIHKIEDETDEQTYNLALQVAVQLAKDFTPDRGQTEAINRLKMSANNHYAPDMHRNNIFKAAHALGIKLPSSMF